MQQLLSKFSAHSNCHKISIIQTYIRACMQCANTHKVQSLSMPSISAPVFDFQWLHLQAVQTFIKVWSPTVTHVLTEFRTATREPKETQSEELHFFPRVRNKCFIFWRDPKETFWLSSEHSAVEQYYPPLSHLRLLQTGNAGPLMGHDFVRLSIYGIWGSEGNQKETTWLQYKAIQRQLEGSGEETGSLFLAKQLFQVH